MSINLTKSLFIMNKPQVSFKIVKTSFKRKRLPGEIGDLGASQNKQDNSLIGNKDIYKST